MKTRRIYQVPFITVDELTASEQLLEVSSPAPTAGFVSGPGIGEAGEGDKIGTESRRNDNGFWNE